MRFTVGIPVYNAMPFLPESLESILGQRYQDFTLLVINDGSTDGSLDYLTSVRDRRLRLVSQSNRGLTATLNRMLAECKTPWLVRFDADDVAHPDRLAITSEYVKRYPQAGMFYSFAEYYPKRSVGLFRSTSGSPQEIRALVQSGFLPSICHPTVTLNAAKAISAGGYRFNLHVEDIDLWWRMALRYEITLIPEITIGFRQNLQSVSSANLERQALNTHYVQYLLLSHLRQQEPLPYEEAAATLSRLLNRRRFAFKTRLREANIALGQGHRLRGLSQAARALLASPDAFLSRLRDEYFPAQPISLGEPPARFAACEQELWPRHSASSLDSDFAAAHAPARITDAAVVPGGNAS